MQHLERIVENETPFETGERASYMTYEAIAKFMEGYLVKGLVIKQKKMKKKNILNYLKTEKKWLIELMRWQKLQ